MLMSSLYMVTKGEVYWMYRYTLLLNLVGVIVMLIESAVLVILMGVARNYLL